MKVSSSSNLPPGPPCCMRSARVPWNYPYNQDLSLWCSEHASCYLLNFVCKQLGKHRPRARHQLQYQRTWWRGYRACSVHTAFTDVGVLLPVPMTSNSQSPNSNSREPKASGLHGHQTYICIHIIEISKQSLKKMELTKAVSKWL